MVVRCVPSPIEAQRSRIETLFDPKLNSLWHSTENNIVSSSFDSKTLIVNKMNSIRKNIMACRADDFADVVVFISKMVPVKISEFLPRDRDMLLAQNSANNDGPQINNALNSDDEIFVALGRVYSGVLHRDLNLYVLSHRHDPLPVSNDSIMDIESSTPDGYNEETPDQVLNEDVPAHLATTAKRIPPRTIEPLVSYRETVFPCEPGYQPSLPPPWCDISGLSSCVGGHCQQVFAAGGLKITLSCSPLPPSLVSLLDSHCDAAWIVSEMISKYKWTPSRLIDYYSSQAGLSTVVSAAIVRFVDNYVKLVKDSIEANAVDVMGDFSSSYVKLGSELDTEKILSLILSFGSKSVLTNCLIMSKASGLNLISDGTDYNEKLGSISMFEVSEEKTSLVEHIWTRLQSALVAGFQETCAAGPIMQEPLFGVCYTIENININLSLAHYIFPQLSATELATKFSCLKPLDITPHTLSNHILSSGSLITDMKSGLKLSMLSCPLRIVEPIYACDLQCDQTQLGNLYGVLSKRRGEVTKEDIIDGTSLFLLSTTLPVSESFGFAQELLRKTSGNATAPQLIFSHWSIIQDNPFWKPQTEDELEKYGDSYVSEHNILRACIDKVRKRKGLPIEEKVVVSAEKQRNMNRKK
ncbi:unnamed protein product [Sphagnum jensenii]|uniref:Elongation factor EFG domain-containing protein n=1 Tax=Sphagnum jensenii TaxID=128206 RepID=A0ABP0V956_9BRYO